MGELLFQMLFADDFALTLRKSAHAYRLVDLMGVARVKPKEPKGVKSFS